MTLLLIGSMGTLAWLLTYLAAKDTLIKLMLGQPFVMRASFVILAAGGAAYFMGYFFPLGLRVVSSISPDLIAWAWGINAGFTVLGSIVAIIVAMNSSFDLVFKISAAIYVAAPLSLLLMERERN